MSILNDYVNKAKVYFDLSDPKPIKARVTLEDGEKEDVMLYDGMFLKGKNGYAPLFYVKDGVEIQIGIGDRILKVPTGESAFWNIPPEFIALARKHITNVTVQVYDERDISLLAKIYNYLIKVAPDLRHKYERYFILKKFDSLDYVPGSKYVILNSVYVRDSKIENYEISTIELNDGRTLVVVKDVGIYLFFDTNPTALAIKMAIPLVAVGSDYAIATVKTNYGDVPITIHTPLGDVVSLIKRMRSGVVVISKEQNKFIAKLNQNIYFTGDIADLNEVKKMEKRLEFSHASPAGDVRFFKNKWGNKVIVVFTKYNPTVELIDEIEEYIENIKYTKTWVKGIAEEMRKTVTMKIPSAVAGFVGKVFKPPKNGAFDLDEF